MVSLLYYNRHHSILISITMVQITRHRLTISGLGRRIKGPKSMATGDPAEVVVHYEGATLRAWAVRERAVAAGRAVQGSVPIIVAPIRLVRARGRAAVESVLVLLGRLQPFALFARPLIFFFQTVTLSSVYG